MRPRSTDVLAVTFRLGRCMLWGIVLRGAPLRGDVWASECNAFGVGLPTAGYGPLSRSEAATRNMTLATLMHFRFTRADPVPVEVELHVRVFREQ